MGRPGGRTAVLPPPRRQPSGESCASRPGRSPGRLGGTGGLRPALSGPLVAKGKRVPSLRAPCRPLQPPSLLPGRESAAEIGLRGRVEFFLF